MDSPKIQLSRSVRTLKGVGPEKERLLEGLGVRTVLDLLQWFPRRYEHRCPVISVSEIKGAGKECVLGIIDSRSLIRAKNGMVIFKAVVSDGQNRLFVIFYQQPYLLQAFKPKSQIILYGSAEKQGKLWQMVHPEYEIGPSRESGAGPHFGRITPVYPLTEDLTQKFLRQLQFGHNEDSAACVDDPLPKEYCKDLSLADLASAYHNIHFPETSEHLRQAYERLVFDEFFGLQLLIEQKRMRRLSERGIFKHGSENSALEDYIRSLPFHLTAGQRNAIEEMRRDLEAHNPMNRLMQGDVGSGKTVVASAAVFLAHQNGHQSAMMAPTEVLAQQLFYSLNQLLGSFGIRIGYLAQAVPPLEKNQVLNALAAGELDVVVGTHALIEQNIKFHKLGLVVVDEQHKFGVFQRLALKKKASREPHFLLMTATPIPRTLSMTLYGDMDISVVADKPAGRIPIKTLWLSEDKRTDLYRWLDRELTKGFQAFVVCPLIEQASEFSKDLQVKFEKYPVGLLHGKMKPLDKTKMMQSFKDGKIKILVSTTVIEVGVDVPNACFLVIENADRFGLAQLHQLRGRVGRGQGESYCILFSDTQNPETLERLSIFQETSSGFEIAEKDLENRGPGDRVGSQQHGLPRLRIGDISMDFAIHERAKDLARRLIMEDPDLSKPKHHGLRRMIGERFMSLQLKQKMVGEIA